MNARTLAGLAAFTVLAACARPLETVESADPVDPVDALDGQRGTPEITVHDGTVVYQGLVTAEGESEAGFWYRRHVEKMGGGWRWSIHRSFAREDRRAESPLVEQVAVHDERYGLISYAEEHHQIGMRATIVVTADRLRFDRTQRGRTSSRSLPRRRDVVVGPTLFGYLLRHEAELADGESLDFDFAVATRASVYRFFAVEEAAEAKRRRFRIRCRSIILRWAVGDLLVEYDPSTDRVTWYAGPVPLVDGRGRGLRARVDYSYAEGRRYY